MTGTRLEPAWNPPGTGNTRGYKNLRKAEPVTPQHLTRPRWSVWLHSGLKNFQLDLPMTIFDQADFPGRCPRKIYDAIPDVGAAVIYHYRD